ncbi:hypothetical protein [Streptococcus fryi]
MKSSKSEIVYFILTVMVLSLAGFLYVFFGNKHQVVNPNTQMTVTQNTDKPEEKAEDKPEDVRLAEDYLATLDKELNAENLATAQAAIDIVSNQQEKDRLQEALNGLSAELDNQGKAQELVLQAESVQSTPNWELAQNAVNALTKETLKNELQNRLNVVKQNIDAYNQANGITAQ